MANPLYRQRLRNDIRYALSEARDAAGIEHPGLLGRIRELAASRLLTPLLPSGFELGTGKVTDRWGKLSGEIDLVIHNPSVLPPLLYSARDGVFPIESAYYAIEIKSSATAGTLQAAIAGANDLLALDWHGKEKARAYGKLCPTVPVFFAFRTDLAQPGMHELARYSRYDPDWKTDPILKAICIVGSGYWYFDYRTGKWEFHPATDEQDEVIDFLGNVVNTVSSIPAITRTASLGDYLQQKRTVYTVNGLPAQNGE